MGISPLHQLLLVLRFYALGTMLVSIADFVGEAVAYATWIIQDLSRAIAVLYPDYVKILDNTQFGFHSIAGFPRVLGATDCTHISMQSPIGRKVLNIIRPYSGAAAAPKSKKAQKHVDPRRIFKVYRFDGILTNGQPQMKSYDLDVSTCGKMVLDALIKIKDMDPTLAFRRSCREGICGSCAVNLQGNNCLACITEIPPDKTITIYPIPHMYVIRDLVVDMTHFFNGYDSIRPYLIRHQRQNKLGSHQYAQSIEDNAKLVGLYECVLCACCSTSCPSYWWNGRRFLGPATLLHAYRWIIDSRDEDTEARLYDLKDDFAAFRCHTIMNCTLACPKGLSPHEHIAHLKRLISRVAKKPEPGIDTMKYASGGGQKR